ncbi:MAG: hypothetical protein ACR2G0_08455 [Chthoniobacterales bacterium]
MEAKKIAWLLAVPLLCLTTTAARAIDDLPTQEKFARYEPMLKRSPFAVATAGAPIAASPNFAKDLYVANAAHSTSGDFVTLASTTNKDFKEYLNTSETVNGFSLSTIEWSDQVGETKVTIAKDGQFATLTFNEALLSQTIQNPVPQAPQPAVQPGRPNPNAPVRNSAPVIQRPMPVPQIPTPPPHVRPVIRRKTAQQWQQQARDPRQSAQSQDDGSDDGGDLDEP